MAEKAIYPALGFVAVALGAFGAHGLEGRLTLEATGWWETATFYLLVHAGLSTALSLQAGPSALRRVAAGLMGSGSALFAATLYAMALGAPRILGAVTPIGGTLMLAGWAVLGVHMVRRSADA